MLVLSYPAPPSLESCTSAFKAMLPKNRTFMVSISRMADGSLGSERNGSVNVMFGNCWLRAHQKSPSHIVQLLELPVLFVETFKSAPRMKPNSVPKSE